MAPATTTPARVALPGGLVLFGRMPGALMYRRPYPAGVPDFTAERGGHLRQVEGSPAFSTLPPTERSAVFDALGSTLRRCEYHRCRYSELRNELDERRRGLPGEVFWDEFAETLHFEMQAYCGAARMVLDEVMYLVARRHGVSGKRARSKPWSTSDLVSLDLPPECNVAEVLLLRQRAAWFKELNTYRNAVFHHGWTHGSGHFAAGDDRGAAKDPAANALLVPDLASLAGKSKPHERTFETGRTVDDVVHAVSEGLDDFLNELFTRVWEVPAPDRGTLPREEHPNIFVALATPYVFVVQGRCFFPLFTSRELAVRFEAAASEAGEAVGGGDVELVEVPVVSLAGRRGIHVTLRGFETSELAHSSLEVLLDPTVADEAWTRITAAMAVKIDVSKVLADPTLPLSVEVSDGVSALYAWKSTSTRRDALGT